MRRKIVISALIAAILLTASCIGGGMAVPIPPPGITGDNSGGAIVTYAVYETLTEQDYYVQRISPEGDFLWGERGVLIGSTGNGIPYSKAVSDGSGGAIVTWGECLPEVQGEPPSCQTYVARIDSEGNVQGQREVPEVLSIMPDGSGGVIISCMAGDAKPSLLKIDSEGNLPWGEDGVSVGLVPEHSDEMASDGSGGVITVLEIDEYGSEDIIYAQRVDSEGNTLWGSGGVQVFVGPAKSPRVAGDGSGGAVIVFEQLTPSEDGIGYIDSDIYVQKVDAEGDILWGPDGVPICVGASHQYSPQIVADGAGGAIVFFVDERGVCAQRVDADGHKSWNEDVELLATTYYSLVSDGSGGAFCVSYYGVAKRLDATGRELWGSEGITFTPQAIHEPGLALVPDGCGGLLISWAEDVKWTHYEISNVSYYVQRVDAEGNVMWGDEEILLNP